MFKKFMALVFGSVFLLALAGPALSIDKPSPNPITKSVDKDGKVTYSNVKKVKKHKKAKKHVVSKQKSVHGKNSVKKSAPKPVTPSK